MGQSGKARRGIRAQATGPGRFASAGGGPQQRPGPAEGTRAYARSESAASATASAVKPNSRNSVA